MLGTMYFVQGIGEPSDGLLAQPMMGLMKSWQLSPEQIATFSAMLGLPWALKPLYGLLTDFVPLFGYRRKSYLIAANLVATLGFLVMAVLPWNEPSPQRLLLCLLIPALGVAVADVVIDALMVELGQPAGITGTLQSIQWGSICASAILTGVVGGHVSEHGWYRAAFVACALLSAAMCWVAITLKEPRLIEGGDARSTTTTTSKPWRTIAAVLAVVVLWHFNPFSNAVLYLYMTGPLELSESFYGLNVTVLGVGSLIGCFAYSAICRRLEVRRLLQLAIVYGVVSTLGYMELQGERSAIVVSVLMGFTSMTATLALLDATARVCPPLWAGTVFAGVMSAANASAMLSTYCGGVIYERSAATWDPHTAFRAVVLLGTVTTAACWLFVPLLAAKENEPQINTDEHG
jgi:MFS family permease